MSTYKHKYLKYKHKYKNLLNGGDILNNNKEDTYDYLLGIINLYLTKDTKDTKILNITDNQDAYTFSKKFNAYTNISADNLEDNIKKLKKLITDDKTYDIILVRNYYHTLEDYGVLLDKMFDLLQDTGVIIIDELKTNKNLESLTKYIIKVAPKKYNISVKHFNKKIRDIYTIKKDLSNTEKEEIEEIDDKNIKASKDKKPKKANLIVPPAERWY